MEHIFLRDADPETQAKLVYEIGVCAARNGADTLLVERNSFLGGQSTASFQVWFGGATDILTGFAKEMAVRLDDLGGAGLLERYRTQTAETGITRSLPGDRPIRRGWTRERGNTPRPSGMRMDSVRPEEHAGVLDDPPPPEPSPFSPPSPGGSSAFTRGRQTSKTPFLYCTFLRSSLTASGRGTVRVKFLRAIAVRKMRAKWVLSKDLEFIFLVYVIFLSL